MIDLNRKIGETMELIDDKAYVLHDEVFSDGEACLTCQHYKVTDHDPVMYQRTRHCEMLPDHPFRCPAVSRYLELLGKRVEITQEYFDLRNERD